MAELWVNVNQRLQMAQSFLRDQPVHIKPEQVRKFVLLSGELSPPAGRLYPTTDNASAEPARKRQKLDVDPIAALLPVVLKPAAASSMPQALADTSRRVREAMDKILPERPGNFQSRIGVVEHVHANRFTIGRMQGVDAQGSAVTGRSNGYVDANRQRFAGSLEKLAVALEHMDASINRRPPVPQRDGIAVQDDDSTRAKSGPKATRGPEKSAPKQLPGQTTLGQFFQKQDSPASATANVAALPARAQAQTGNDLRNYFAKRPATQSPEQSEAPQPGSAGDGQGVGKNVRVRGLGERNRDEVRDR